MTPVQDKGRGEMGVVLTCIDTCFGGFDNCSPQTPVRIVLHTYSHRIVLSPVRTCFKGGSSGVTNLFFLNINKKRVEQGNPEEWCARHFCVVFTQFWNFAHTIVIHIFFDFCGTISKNSFLFTKGLAHISIYAIHFRSAET